MDRFWKAAIPLERRGACPWRALEWRWRLASHVLDGRRLRAWRGRWLSRATRFIRAESRVRSRRSHRIVDPAIAAARAIWLAGDNTRIEVEARLLTGESLAETAIRCGLDEEVVEAYEQLFYAVGDVLDARAYVTAMALPHLHGSRRASDPETILKVFALNGGPLVLDRLLHVLGIRAAPAGSEPTAREVRLTRLALSAKRLTATSMTFGEIHKLMALAEELDQRARDSHYVPVYQPAALLVDPFDAIPVDEVLAALDEECGLLAAVREAGIGDSGVAPVSHAIARRAMSA